MASTLDALDNLLETLLLTGTPGAEISERATQYQDLAIQRAITAIRADTDELSRRRFELRLRLALHLAPREAISYDGRRPTPRWELIAGYLVSALGRLPSEAQPIARSIATVLDAWDERRESVTRARSTILRSQKGRCAHCKVAFGSTTVAARRDEYKPYFASPEELLVPEVDHIEAISAFGTNLSRNLQVLCRLCNWGKGDGLGIDVRREATYAGFLVEQIHRQHRAAMLYYIIERDRGTCTNCGDDSPEMTIRPLSEQGGYVRSNLQTVCYNCARSPKARGAEGATS